MGFPHKGQVTWKRFPVMTSACLWWHLINEGYRHRQIKVLFLIALTMNTRYVLYNISLSDSPRREHDDVIKWKRFSRYRPFVRGIHRPPVDSPHKGLWRGALMFSLISAWTNSWANNRDAGDLRCHRAHCDVTIVAWQAKGRHSV